MNTFNRVLLVSALTGAALAAAVPVHGQTPGTKQPYSRLFGGKSARSTGQALDLTVSLSEGYNDDTSPQISNVVDPTLGQAGGLQTMLVANANYTWLGAKGQFAANSSSSFAYYNDLEETRSISHSAAVGFSAELSPQTTVLVNQTAAYSPSYLYGLFPTGEPPEPGDGIPPAPDYSVQARETYTFGTSAGLTHNLTRRNRVTVSGDFNYTDYVQETINQRDMKVASVRGQFARNVTRNTSVALGYRYRNGQVGISFEPTQEHLADVGVDHSRPLSPTRRANFGFRVGVSAVEIPPVAAQLFEATGRRYFADGELSFGYQFSSMWSARAMYRRGMEYVPVLVTPVFSDGVSASVDAVFTPRLDLLASAGYSSNQSVFDRESSTAVTYTGDVRLRYALNRKVAGYVQYMYYFYDFQGLRQVVSGIPPQLERHAIRVGMMLWVPAFQR